MQLTITGRQIEVTPELELLLRKKLNKLERIGDKLVSLHAIFGKERYFYTAELTLSAKGRVLVGKAKDQRDLLTCMESALNRLEHQLSRFTSKRMERFRRQAPHRPY